jgi:hypothetical protein
MATPIVIGVPEAVDGAVDPPLGAAVVALEDAPVVAVEAALVGGVVVALEEDDLDEPHAARNGMPIATTPTTTEARRHKPCERAVGLEVSPAPRERVTLPDLDEPLT